MVAVLSTIVASTLQAQDLEETLSTVGSAYAKAYVRPMADALGANLNSGLYHDARFESQRTGLNVYVGVRAFGAFLTSDDETFDLTYQDRVTVTAESQGEEISVPGLGTFEVTDAPTVFGEEDPAIATVTARFDTTIMRYGVAVPVSVDTSFTQEIVGGVLPTNIVPTAVPHLRLGTLYGTDLMVRWLPTITVTDVGSLSLFGLGLRHSVSQYAPTLPLDIAVQVAWQQVNVDDAEEADLVDVSTFAASVVASREFGLLSLYGAFQTETTDIDVQYDLEIDDEAEPVPIAFSVRGAAKVRGLVGLALTPGPLRINVDYSIGQVNVLSAGIGVAF